MFILRRKGKFNTSYLSMAAPVKKYGVVVISFSALILPNLVRQSVVAIFV